MAACNVRHLALARKLESVVEQRLERAPKLSEDALRNLAVVSAAAQRISRLALGASTENVHRNPYAQMTDAESRDDLLHKIADGEHAFDGFTLHHCQI